jgi:hypothetical protein
MPIKGRPSRKVLKGLDVPNVNEAFGHTLYVSYRFAEINTFDGFP